jgi:spermidine/putrescine transport system substrate-binding protein
VGGRQGSGRPMDRFGAPLSRRSFLRAAGVGAGALSLSALLAACGGDGGGGSTASPSFDWSTQKQAGDVTFVNWPLYIDSEVTKSTGERTHPTLELFTEQTGIDVSYLPQIQSYEEFHAKIFPLLAAGQSTGYDLIMTGVPKWFPILIGRHDLIPLDQTRLTNFRAHAAAKYRDPSYDPGNRFGIPYQSGITGIGYDIAATGREITSLQDLFDPEFSGKVGMFRDTVDTPCMALLALGIDPPESTQADWQKAVDLLTKQRDDGIVRQYYGQGYIGALQTGEVALTLAWSADVLQSQNSGYDNLRFVVPEEGGLLWTDIMAIPVAAEHPVDAMTLMDFFYEPKIAAQLTSWIQNVSPVPQAQDILRSQGDPVADNPLVFPTEEMYARLHGYRDLEPSEQDAWNEMFLAVYQA